MATQVLKRLDGHPFLGWLGLIAHADLLKSWTRRDLEVRYQGSFLGKQLFQLGRVRRLFRPQVREPDLAVGGCKVQHLVEQGVERCEEVS